MTTFADVVALVMEDIARPALQSVAEARLRSAVRWLERNEKMHFNKRWVEFSLDTTSRLVAFPLRLRSIEFFRLVNSDGTFTYLTKVHPRQISNTSSGTPAAYWTDGEEHLVLDVSPESALSAEICYHQYTDHQALADSSRHWLFDNAEDLLVAQTLLTMAAAARLTPLQTQQYKMTRDEGLRTLMKAEEDFAEGPTADPVMEYTGQE